MRQISDTATDSDDLLAMPWATDTGFHCLTAEREALIAQRTAAAHKRHAERDAAHGLALLGGAVTGPDYRAAMAESKAQRDREIAHQPPAVDSELSRARVGARLVEAKPRWWADELARAQAAQQAWVAANADSAAEANADADTDAGVDADVEREQVIVNG